MRRPAPAAFLAALLLPLAVAPAFAGASITKPFGEARRDSLGPDGMPVPGVALRLSLNGTALPVGTGAAAFALGAAAQSPHVILIGAAFTAAGLVLGPAAGYRYGDVPGHGVSGIALRAALIAGPPLLASASAPTGSNDDVRNRRIGYAAIGGGALAIALAIWDIEHVEGAVRRRNAGAAGGGVGLAPATAPFSHAPGLALRVGLGPGGD